MDYMIVQSANHSAHAPPRWREGPTDRKMPCTRAPFVLRHVDSADTIVETTRDGIDKAFFTLESGEKCKCACFWLVFSGVTAYFHMIYSSARWLTVLHATEAQRKLTYSGLQLHYVHHAGVATHQSLKNAYTRFCAHMADPTVPALLCWRQTAQLSLGRQNIVQ